MRIALLDLNHLTRGVHTNTVPLNLGLISRYLRKTVDYKFDIKMFKVAQEVLDILPSWKPDVLGISQYSWNSQLNLYVAKIVKEHNPRCFAVAGGPNLDFLDSRRIEFFKDNPWVDIGVYYDGEIPFAEIMKLLISGKNPEEIKQHPVAGTYSFDFKTNSLKESGNVPPRVNSLDEFGPMYADGLFDELLDRGFHPFVQTHRGCPFECTYCHTSDRYYSKILFLSPDIFRKEMEYLGKRFSGQHNVTLYIANTNFSLYHEDFPIAEIIRQTQVKYDWPKIINVNCGKDPKKLLDLLSIIKCEAAISLQTLTPKVLVNIKRKNIPLPDFISFMRNASKKTGEMSSTDLILCLPEETKESFIATLKAILNSGIQSIYIFTLMNLKGTPISSDESVSRYQYVIRHRIVPRQFSIIDGKKIFDTEEVIVGTNTMPFEDYLELRGIAFLITIFFSSMELFPLKRLLQEYGVDMYRWIDAIRNKLPDFPKLSQYYNDFMQETKDELFVSREALVEFYNKQDNFDALCQGRLGDNLLRKYKCIVLSQDFKAYLDLALSEALVLLKESVGAQKAQSLIDDLFLYLSSRDLKQFLKGKDPYSDVNIELTYDVPAWMADSENTLKLDLVGKHHYQVSFTEKSNSRLKDFMVMNRDSDLSLQILYRDGTIKDFWPVWSLQK
ncbi:MAG: B12-binding domain-containing radical SAM protein [Candidatus Omnitrophota bacterium]